MSTDKNEIKKEVVLNALREEFYRDRVLDCSKIKKVFLRAGKRKRKNTVRILDDNISKKVGLPLVACPILGEIEDGIFTLDPGKGKPTLFKKSSTSHKNGETCVKIKGLKARIKMTLYYNSENVLHREGDRPALVINGTRIWYKNGMVHRDGDKPAIIKTNNTSLQYYKENKLHRDGAKPAIMINDGAPAPLGGNRREIYKNGKFCLKYTFDENGVNASQSINFGKRNKCGSGKFCQCAKEFSSLNKREFMQKLMEAEE